MKIVDRGETREVTRSMKETARAWCLGSQVRKVFQGKSAQCWRGHTSKYMSRGCQMIDLRSL